MSTPVSPPGSVYTGLWTDWTHDRSQGLTLTVPASHGAVLIAFLAIFVKISGGHLWDIFCYIIFHVQSTPEARDGLHHQQQALLRNNLSDNRAIWQFSSIAWEWRGKTKGPLVRTLPLILSAALHFIAFTAAGIFSSKVASIGSTVLIRGPTCGNWTVPFQGGTFNKTRFTETSEQASWLLSNYKSMAGYTKSCYTFDNDTKSSPQDCLAYGRRLLSWSTDTDIACPFADGMCIDGSALELDSGHVDSHMDLGINGRLQDRVSFRHLFQCAPIITEGFVTKNLSYSQTGFGQAQEGPIDAQSTYTGYSYGPNLYYGINYTFIYDNNTFGGVWCDCLGPTYLISQLPPQASIPVKSLNQTDGDLWMFFVINDQPIFAEPVKDPVFKADVPFTTVQAYETGKYDVNYVNVTYFAPPAPVSVIGCASQYQWCNPNKEDSCTKLSGSEAVNVDSIGYNRQQKGLYERLTQALGRSTVGLIASGLGDSALLASSIASGTQVSVPLPDNQWIRELNYWFGMHLTNTQLQVLQYATGTGNAAWDRGWKAPASEDEWMCSNQMVQRNDYSSINMLGVILILCFGLIFVLVNAFLERIVTALRSEKREAQGVSPWRMHHVLQLQSMLYEALGAADWNREALVPVTVDRATFELPDVEKLNEKCRNSDVIADRTSRWTDNSDDCGGKSASSEGVYLLDVPPSNPLVWSNDIGRSGLSDLS